MGPWEELEENRWEQILVKLQKVDWDKVLHVSGRKKGGADGISPWLYNGWGKACKEMVRELFKVPLRTGYGPEVWKLALKTMLKSFEMPLKGW